MLRNRLRVVRKPKSDKQYTPLTWIEALSMCGQYIRVHMHIACVECHIHINQTYTHIASIDTCVTSHTITKAWGDENSQQNLFRAAIRNATVMTCIASIRDNACVMHLTYHCIHITLTRRRSCVVYIHPLRGHLRRVAGALGQATRAEADPGQSCMYATI